MRLRPSVAARGFALAFAAAVAFGATAPIVQHIGRGIGPFATAALLYVGAASVAWLTKRRAAAEAPLRTMHAPRLVVIALAGAVVAPTALAWGLQHTNGTSASLMLNVEAPLTVLFGALLYREHVGRRVWLALAFMMSGALLLFWGRASEAPTQAIGLFAIFVATVGWAFDNTLTVRLSSFDSSSVVFAKAAMGAPLSAILALSFHETWPRLPIAAGLIACGATGYGASLRLYLLAQRHLGAGRTASIFGVAPFVAAIMAFALGQSLGLGTLLAAAPMAIGLYLHLSERHEHRHIHDSVEHEHAHVHDDGHHTHAHVPMPAGAHSHLHRHDAIEHVHEHMPDVHHGHAH
jgi:drug/metabolite transporter (DMT)-like permease